MKSQRQIKDAGLRIAEELVKAKHGNYYLHGWASYINRVDVETLLLSTLDPVEARMYELALEDADAA